MTASGCTTSLAGNALRHLPAAMVSEIRRRFANGECAPSIAEDLGIRPQRAWKIATGRSHARVGHVPDLARRVGRRRSLRGEAHPMARLTEAEVLSIRRLHRDGVSQRELAASFGVSKACVSQITRRFRWTHI